MADTLPRRGFLAAALAGATALATGSNGEQAQAARPRPVHRMKLGHQHHDSDADLRIMAALGVGHICSGLPSRKLDSAWTVAGLSRLRERVEKFGIALDAVPLPMSSVAIEQAEMPNIMLGKSPERDREMDQICLMIENAAKAGIFLLKYNLTLLGVPRTASTAGRGNARYSTFTYDKADQDKPTIAGKVTADDYWERVTYFLKRVIPVAEASKVRLACHPNDPSMQRRVYRGIECPLGTVEGLKRFIDIAPSPYHGLNFCQGTVCEMLDEPGKEIFDVIRYFGSRKKIFNVHFRNIKGRVLDFQETLPDNGDVDMLRALRVYQEVSYDGMVMPDHVPVIEGDSGGALAYAYSFGYIQALLQTLPQEA